MLGVKDYNYVKNEINDVAKRRLSGLSDSFERLAGSVNCLANVKVRLSKEDFLQIYDDVSVELCRSCEKEEECHAVYRNENYEEIEKLLQEAAEGGRIREFSEKSGLRDRCIKPQELIRDLNRNFGIANMKLEWHNRFNESREAVAGQLCEIAKIVGEFSDGLCDGQNVLNEKKFGISAMLRAHRVKSNGMVISNRENRGLMVKMRAKTTGGRYMTTKEAAVLISLQLGRRFVPGGACRNIIGREYSDYIFFEDTSYEAVTGVARASKVKGELSGDNFSFMYTDNGDLIIMLSDGMGSGRTAYNESEMTIELLEQFLEAGFSEKSAIKMINSALVLRPEQSVFSTMDLCVINLCTGTCELVKLGAASTFIKRDGLVEEISTQALPVGIMRDTEYDVKCRKLYDGDYIIMISDGVLDCVTEENKEEYLKSFLLGLPDATPQEMAGMILTAALELHGYKPEDDMTVLVCAIKKKSA